jgi:glycosyltransferase involved in cell wall biosynthesis
MRPAPLVSVITATYNRSRVLKHAIESVRRSTVEDWELLVVGDHCTDDTAEVVAAFDDPRISFVNLPRNAGEQSAANNEGLRRARGRYIAFLNHDDLYFPDHLASSVAFCEKTGADLVWSPMLVPLPGSEADLLAGRWQFNLSGVPGGDDYDPRVFIFASAWLLTRALAEKAGPWRPARETFVTSSQDWLFRAWRSGARMRFLPHVGTLAVPAGVRRGAYAELRSPEHDYFAAEMQTNARFREMALEIAAIESARSANRYGFGRPWHNAIRSSIFRHAGGLAMRLGVHPLALYVALRYGRRGNLINARRRYTGLRAKTRRD